ncbi:hypothetical protein [Clostridium tertium]|uniref:hypothetical protein n=1 Tax=Clostridium tertium TaxID=1559 RepID=UPI0023B22D57|nr:hypothetical protein [Clostridium tertium]
MLKDRKVTSDFINLIPSVCKCGYELEVNDQLTSLACSSPICPYHMAAKMESMLKTLNVKDIGRAICLEIIEKNNFTHHTEIFSMTVNDFPDNFSSEYRTKLYKGLMEKKPRTFGEVLRACEFTGLDSRALVIGKGFTSADDFYKAYNYNYNFIKQRLKINKDTTPLRIHRILIENESIIRKVSSWFTLEKEADIVLKVAITGAIKTVTREDGSKYRPREEFVKEMRDKYMKWIDIKLVSSITRDVSYLISDEVSTHGKYTQAKELDIPIITCKKFKEIVDIACNNLKSQSDN